MRICFVGNAFHRRTRSHAFFLDILEGMADVTAIFVNMDAGAEDFDDAIRLLIRHPFDRYIFWQTDRIAEFLMPLELGPTFLVPMYDSVHHHGPAYWQRFSKCHLLAFSRALHESARAAGLRSSYFQYFPPPGSLRKRDFEKLSGFFWERLPESALNLERVVAQCRSLGVERLHVHAVPDTRGRDATTGLRSFAGLDLTTSTWFEHHEDFQNVASDPLFFFASRDREGIGMALLEAMARGQIVIAPDYPTANEYVAHRVSGLLYQPDAPFDAFDLPRLDADALAAMSAAAYRRIVEGRQTWLMDISRLESIIRGDDRRWPTGDYSAHFAAAIRQAAHARAGND